MGHDVETTGPIKLSEGYGEEWERSRQMGIGASEAAAACGLSQYATPLEVYHRKRGNLPVVEQNTAMRMGSKLEHVILDEWMEQNAVFSRIQSPVGLYQHPETQFVLATPDALVDETLLVDAKASSWYVVKDIGDSASELPMDWYCQGQQQMYVMGTALMVFAILIDGRTLKSVEVPRNDEHIQRIVEAERELWERIQNGDPPEPTFEHPSTLDLIRDIYGVEQKTVELSPDAVECFRRSQQYKQEIKELEVKSKTMMARVYHEMGDASQALCGDRVLTRSVVGESEVSYVRKSYTTLRNRARRDDE